MGDNKLLGCLGVLVGIVVVIVLGWMSFELLAAIGAELGDGLASGLLSPVLHHEIGELLVVGLTILGVYVLVFRGYGAVAFAQRTRHLFWLGAALNLLAWARMPAGNRWSGWMLLLAAVGIIAPWLLGRAGEQSKPPPPQPF